MQRTDVAATMDIAHRGGRSMRVLAALALALLGWHAPALAAGCPSVGSAPPPVEAVAGYLNEPNWQKRVSDLDGIVANTDLTRVRTLFLGDSITEAWEPVLFDHFYANRAPLNLGVRGDTTQGLLWRLTRMPLGTTLRPQLIVLLIGTNDLWAGVNPANVATGIGEVVRQLRQRSPQSHILLVGLLPRGEGPEDPLRPYRTPINALISQCAGGMVTYADPGAMLLDGNGRMTKDFSYDALHMTWIGYAILAAGLEPYVRQILGG
jgi:lysophospholipase L1-like esterase